MDSVLVCGIDGFERTLADAYGHPFWEAIRDDITLVELPKPGAMEEGEVSTASSPRLWGRLYTGTGPHTNGALGFWEKLDSSGNVVRSGVDKDWIMEHRCEKLVMYDDFRVPTLWDLVADAGLGFGLSGAWFTYALPDRLKAHIDDVGGWCLTDAPFPYDHPEFMDRERIAHPDEVFPDYWPEKYGEAYLEEVGSGMRTPELAKEDPWGFYQDLLSADRHRYLHLADQLEEYGEQPLTMTLTRGTDALAHKFRDPDDISPHYPEELQDPEENMRRVVKSNFDYIEMLWDEFDFDHLLIGGDHGCGCRVEDGELIFEGDDHEWPGYWAIYSDEVPSGVTVRAKYEDIAPTVLELLGIDPPEHLEGASVIGQAEVSSRLTDLGYAP